MVIRKLKRDLEH